MWSKRNPISVRISTALTLFNKTENDIDLFIDNTKVFVQRLLSLFVTIHTLCPRDHTAIQPQHHPT